MRPACRRASGEPRRGAGQDRHGLARQPQPGPRPGVLECPSLGTLFGLAIAAKLNFAPLGLAVGLFVLGTGGRCGLRAACWLAAGAAAGMVPMLIGAMLAPDAFLYGVLTYGATAPHAWYAANGAMQELTLTEKLADLLKYLWKGPALAALILLCANWIVTRRRIRSPGRRLAIWMTVGALAGAALPTPSQLQYMMPLLPPLALAIGYLLDDARRWPAPRRAMLIGLLSMAAIPGLVATARDLAAMARTGSPAMAGDEGARWMGAVVRANGRDDDIATLAAWHDDQIETNDGADQVPVRAGRCSPSPCGDARTPRSPSA